MAEAVRGYPRWTGELSRGPRALTIARREVERAWQNSWARGALTLAVAYAVVVTGNLYALRNRPDVHTLAAYVDFIELMGWAGLVLAAVMAGPALLEDARRGALELYLSRAATRWDYLLGKSLAVFAVSFAAVALPALIYWAGSWLAFETHPEGWGYAWLGGLGHALLWAVVVAGLGLGLSCVSRSSRAATLILFGGVAVLDVLFGRVLTNITRDETLLVLSPLAQAAQQATWLFGTSAPYGYPWWWGLIGLAGLAAAGWGLVVWRHPRLKGVE